MNNLKKIFEFTKISCKLKSTQRWLNTKTMITKESSADHSWHLALLVPIVARELKLDVNIERSMMLALVHDLVEAIAGDTDHSLIVWGIKTAEAKNNEEIAAMVEIRKSLSKETGTEIHNIWNEYEAGKTPEARYVKALDKIETINHMLVIGHESFDHPELIAPYPKKAVLNFPELKPLYQELLDRLKPEFAKKGWEWSDEYNI